MKHGRNPWTRRPRFAGLVALTVASGCRLDDLTSRPPAIPAVTVSAERVADSAMLGSAGLDVTPVALTGPAGAALEWTARLTSPADWLTLDRPSGRAEGGRDTLRLGFHAGTLLPGTFFDTVLVEPGGNASAGARIAVSLVILDCPTTPIAVGATVNDSLTGADCRPPDRGGRLVRSFWLRAPGTDSVSITLTAATFTPYIVLADSLDRAHPIIDGPCGAAPDPCVRYARLSGAGPLRVDVTSTAAGQTGAFALSARAPAPPDPATDLRQFRADGTTAIPPGASVTDSVIVCTALATDADAGDSVHLEVEVRPADTPFQNVATATGASGLAGRVDVRVRGLAGGSYHWQARAADETGRHGPWTAFGAAAQGTPDFALAQPATVLAFASQPTTVTAGATMTPAVTVAARTASGATDTAFAGTITLSLGGGAGATLGGTTSRGAVRGVATFGDLHVDRAGSGYTLTAGAPGLQAATSAAFAVTPAAASRVVVSTQPGSTVAGSAISPAPAVSVQDGFGNTATGYAGSVSVALAPGTGTAGATLSGTLNATASNGTATFPNLHVDRTGAGYQLAISATGLPGTFSTAFDVTPGAATALVFTVQPSNTPAGQTIVPAVRVAVTDALGNVVTTFTTALHMALGRDPNLGLSTLSGTLTVAPVNGIAIFPDLRIDLPGNGFTLRASTAGVPTAESVAFNESL